jgi:hypothetical protein
MRGARHDSKGSGAPSSRRALTLGLTAAAAVVSLSLVICGSALATTGHGFAGSIGGPGEGGDGQFNGGPSGIGVGLSGDVFASEQGFTSTGGVVPRVERFSASGAFQSAFPVSQTEFQFAGAVAVDSALAGGVYVATNNQFTGVPEVVKYTAAGVLAYTLDASGSGTSINGGTPVAVDPANGEVYVAASDTSTGAPVIDSFDQTTGTFIASFDGSTSSPDGGFICPPNALAVDSAHRVYVLDPCKGRVDRYSANGEYTATIDDGSRGAPQALATDPSSDELYVAESGPSGLQITHFSAAGTTAIQTFAADKTGGLAALAVGPAATVYTADSANSQIERYTAFEGPTVTTDAATEVETTSVTLNGTVDPGGVEASYHYVYGLDTSYGAETEEADAGAGSGAVPAPAPITDLIPNSTYHYRIVGSNASGSIVGDDLTFTTLPAPPTLASSITPTGARIHATLDPNHSPTSFHIDYGTTTAYGETAPIPDAEAGEASTDIPVATTLSGLQPDTLYHFRLSADNGTGGTQHGVDATFFTAPGTPAGATDVTATTATLTGTIDPHGESTVYRFNYGPNTSYGSSTPNNDAGSGDGEQAVSQQITGLSPSTTYHVQVVATTNGITRTGADGTFTTLASGEEGCPNEALRAENNSTHLPECRAYELVSNPYKEGFSASPSTYADDGTFYFRSAGNFAGNGLGAPTNAYLAMRSAAGWLTNSLSPNGSAYGTANGHTAPWFFSTDLRSSIWLMRRSDQPTNVAEFYLRRPDGTFTHIGPAANPATLPPESSGTTFTGIALFDGASASADISHFLFTVDASKGFPGDTSHGISSLYEYVGTGNDRPELVGVDNTGHQISQSDTCASGISTDGRVVFFSPGCNGGTAQVWLRINGTTTIEASASECTRTVADPDGACNGPAPANYQGAPSDGSRVYFTTTQQLLNGDTDETNDLYACEIPPGTPAPVVPVNPCADLIEVSGPGSEARVESVLNVSEDGSRVYFVAQGALAANLGTNDATAVAGDHNLYVWQKDAAHPAGQTTFVAKLDSNAFDFGTQSTADGRYLFFITPNQLLATDTDNASDLYRYDADTGALLRLSTDTSGTGGNAEGLGAEGNVLPPGRWRSTITADGTAAVFKTSEALSPADTNGTVDVYEWHQGQVSLISSGRPSPSHLVTPIAWITASGKDIYLITAAQLTPNDADTNVDVYDARIGGGFSFPQAARCSEEACQPSAAGPPVAPTPATNGPGGEGNVKPRSCPKGKVRKGEKCVKKANKQHKKSSKKTKRANTDRRVSR